MSALEPLQDLPCPPLHRSPQAAESPVLFKQGTFLVRLYEGKVKSSWPRLRQIRHKRPLGRDPDRSSWIHGLSESTLVSFRRCPWSHGLLPKKLDTSACPGPYLTVPCPESHVGQARLELFTLPSKQHGHDCKKMTFIFYLPLWSRVMCSPRNPRC